MIRADTRLGHMSVSGCPDNSRGNHRVVAVVSGQEAVFARVVRLFWPHFDSPIIMAIIIPTSCVLCPAVSAEDQQHPDLLEPVLTSIT